MRLNVGEIVELIGLAITLLAGCLFIAQGLLTKRDKKIRGINRGFASADKIENKDNFCLHLSRQLIIHGIITILVACIGIVFIFLRLEDSIVLALIFINIVMYFVRSYRLLKKFYKA